jgi:chromosome segregation ATPase
VSAEDLRARLKAVLAVVEPFDHALTDAVLAEVQAQLDEQQASFDQRLRDVQDEYAKAGASWDTTRDRLNTRIEQLRGNVADAVALAKEHADRAEQTEAERDQLRAAAERVRALHKPASYPSPNGPGEITYCVGCEESDSSHPCLTLAALDQAPAAEQDGGGR